ncbi:hypothetical protein [Halopiger xanaduensis]|uniref:Uncharacterized protein n=1 Tax=Halopiger xanaduensis (strain DSM 18323 / JCM 14033 / SH-6) TaxID=797210 RepID=F8DEU5_HALXS|nr:hypothetical protein [Halopiger xanaduensis]AEH39535.1 hypothetical protein Halxa_0296 [Halopiger xanaduensis SH-6]
MPSIRKQTRKAGSYLGSALGALVRIPAAAVRFTGTQARGTWRNVRGFLGWLSIDRALPPALASTIRWTGETVPTAIGIGDESSYQQTAAASVLLIVAIASTALTFGLTLAAVALLIPFLLVGLWRFIPAFNTVWKDKVQSRDGRVPRWDR